MLPFQTVGKHCRDSFYMLLHLKEIVLTGNDTCLSDGRKM